MIVPSNIMDIGSRRHSSEEELRNDGVLCPPSSIALLEHVHHPRSFVIPPLANVCVCVFFCFNLFFFRKKNEINRFIFKYI